MILPHNDIIVAENRGLIALRSRGEVGATSIDVRVETLYRVRPDTNFITSEMADLPYEKFKKKYLIEEPLIDGSFWLLTPTQHYMAESVEELFLSKDFTAELNSRSSWGRYGVYVKHTEDDMQSLGKDFKGKIPFMISTYGTFVLLRPGDAPGQITFAYETKIPLRDDELKRLIQEEGVILSRDGNQLKEKDIGFNQGLTLTLDDHIKVYIGGVIDPQKPVDDMFVDIKLPKEGQVVYKNQFFISSSAESVKIGPLFLGWVKESNYFNPNPGMSMKPQGITTYKTHPNAPRIDSYPVFEGKITFENLPFFDLLLKPGQRLTELDIYPLNSPYTSEKKHKSRYKGQKKTTSSKGHIKDGPRQMRFDFK